MFIKDNKRINIYAPFESQSGTRYGNLTDPYVRSLLGVVEIPDPQPPEDYSEETYYRTEQDDAPYVVFTRKSDEQIEQARKARIQAQIDAMERESLVARPVREYMILDIETKALAAGHTLEQLRASHFGYRKVKEFDEQIQALRAQL